jgi:hypothetical protein
MRRGGAAGGGAKTCHDIHYAIWQTGLADQLAEPDREQRRLLGWVQTQRVAKGQRGSDFPAQRRQRTIPWNDLPADSDRLV